MQTIILLMVIWILVLTPYIWRRINQFRIDSQIGKYGSTIGSITGNENRMNYYGQKQLYQNQVYPINYSQNQYYKVHPDSNLFYLKPSGTDKDSTSWDESIRESHQATYINNPRSGKRTAYRSKQKRQLTISRRKRNLKLCFASIAFTFMFGLIPVFNFLLYFCIVLTILTASYIATLYYMNNLVRQSLTGGHRSTSPIRKQRAGNIQYLYNGNIDSQHLLVEEIKRKPSFVIVEDPAIQRALP